MCARGWYNFYLGLIWVRSITEPRAVTHEHFSPLPVALARCALGEGNLPLRFRAVPVAQLRGCGLHRSLLQSRSRVSLVGAMACGASSLAGVRSRDSVEGGAAAQGVVRHRSVR